MSETINKHIVTRGESRSRRRTFFPVTSHIEPKQESKSDFNDVLFWARLAASQCRKSPERLHEEAQILGRKGDEETFLAEFFRWRESATFSTREKAAMDLSETFSRKEDRKTVADTMKKTRRFFSVSEMIQLTLSIRTVNEWYDTHACPASCVLIVQDNAAEEDHLRKKLGKSLVDCKAVFARSSEEALRILNGSERPQLRSMLVAVVVDVHLPHINAEELLQNVRITPGVEDLPVIVMTSSPRAHDVNECERLRVMTDEKTVNVNSFLDALVQIVEHRQNPPPSPLDGALPESRTSSLAYVYDRLRQHFDQKAHPA